MGTAPRLAIRARDVAAPPPGRREIAVRLFVALELPAGHRAALEGVCEEGRRGGVRWVPAANVHLTLKFLGEVEETLLPEIEAALAAVASEAAPFSLSLAGGGCFPSPRSPRVVWVGVGAGAEEAAALAAAVDRALRPLGFSREKRRFRAHLTIGRPKGGKESAASAADKIEHLRGFEAPAEAAEVLALVKSTLTPEGAVYDVLARLPLGAD
ncbi:MAG: RNA 2',3'-cyclic phosphodiesterase [Candidatus Coatesbacteria bacterium]|nr:MAG: RNA 2',3'-cyclic phosphodiesterase [Candidatus Coatesbacteria bacterium]